MVYKSYQVSKPSQSSQPSRCTQEFVSDSVIKPKLIKKAEMKLSSEIRNNYKKSKEAKKSFKDGIGIMFKESCDSIISKHSSKSKSNKPYDSCKSYRDNKEKYYKLYIEGLTKKIKGNISKRLTKALNKPSSTKRLNKLSCYIKLLTNISQSKYCKTGSLSIGTILDEFDKTYRSKEKDDTKKQFAKSYLEYLLTKKDVSSDTLKIFNKLYRKGAKQNFVDSLKIVVDKTC